MAATGNEHLWGFLRYARVNPHNSLNDVHWDEIDEMARIYARVNEGGATATETDPGTYDSTTDIPGLTTANEDTTGIGFQTPTTALTDQARYPESHVFAAAGAPI
ncbi:hypothetical protein LCGC14_1258670 [marine sediment metagenome]|uniref:Uncharacterized protein n=1 Tax=marine sediment metagenome TaxID=412755 RepID=A0A0F9L1C2_9ZZZZ